MSYADVTSKGPKQSDAEKAAPAIPEVEHSDSDAGVQSLDSLTSESGVHTLDPTAQTSSDAPSTNPTSSHNAIPSYADQQRAHERAQAAEAQAAQAADKISRDAADFTKKADADLQALRSKASDKTSQAESKARDLGDKAGKKVDALKKDVKTEAGKAQDKARDAEDWAEKNKGNPVVIGNAVVVTALAGLLGIGAYRLHARHALTWKVAGLWAGAVGLFAVGDYYVSQYLFKNKYPTKK